MLLIDIVARPSPSIEDIVKIHFSINGRLENIFVNDTFLNFQLIMMISSM